MTDPDQPKDPNVDTFDHKGADDGPTAPAPRRVKVPAVPGPRAVLCYVTPPLDGSKGNPMRHCDRKASHGGLHTWELADALERLAPLDAAHVRTLVFRLSRAHDAPATITDDEHRSVLRESRDVLEVLAAVLEARA